MKIVSDFDGVLTDQTGEAERAHQLFRSLMVEKTDLPEARVAELLQEARAAIEAVPWDYGWESEGRMSAYANEDLFVRTIGTALYLDRKAPATRFLGDTAASFQELSALSYRQMTEETSRGEHEPFDPVAAQVLQTMLDKGHEVVVVSNSATKRVVELLASANVPVVADEVATGAEGRVVRVCGGAQKYVLSADSNGDTPPGFAVGRYFCAVDRPHYRAILEAEDPDMVIGDVFTLDLALPIALGRSRGRKLRAVLRRRPYTPQWSLGFAAGSDDAFAIANEIQDVLQFI